MARPITTDPALVTEVRALYLLGMTPTKIAERMGIHLTLVWKYIRGERGGHVPYYEAVQLAKRIEDKYAHGRLVWLRGLPDRREIWSE